MHFNKEIGPSNAFKLVNWPLLIIEVKKLTPLIHYNQGVDLGHAFNSSDWSRPCIQFKLLASTMH